MNSPTRLQPCSRNQPNARPHDPAASLAASLLVATWTVALNEAHQSFQQKRDVAKANRVFLALIDRGSKGVQAALAGTPYARPELLQ